MRSFLQSASILALILIPCQGGFCTEGAVPSPDGHGPRQEAREEPELRRLLSPLLRECVATARALGREPRDLLVPRCLDLQASLEKMEADLLFSAPDQTTHRHTARGLESLHHATEACLGHKPFAANYHFQEAARSFVRVFQALDVMGK